MENKKINIILVDDNQLFKKNLKKFIESELNCKVIADACDGKQFLSLSDIHKADIILMDIVMGEMDGLEATQRIMLRHPKLRVIAITMHTEKVYLIQLIETGFKGCVFKPNIFKELPIALKEVMKGNHYFPDYISIEKEY